MLRPSGGALKKIFAPGRVKSATSSATSRPANDVAAKTKAKPGLFGKARKDM